MKLKIIAAAALGLSLLGWSAIAADKTKPPMNSVLISTDQFTGPVGWMSQPATAPNNINIIGIHGTPGSWTAWKNLMEEQRIQTQYSFFAFDRPGWGMSVNELQTMYPKLADQANIMAAAIEEMALEGENILVAHSWGGSVALALAAYHPELVDGMVLIASPASPIVSQPRWYHKAAKSKVVQFMIGKSMSNSNIEMLTLDQELELLSKDLPNVTAPTVIMQGKKDWLVKPENAFYLKRMLENAPVKLDYDMDANHFIPFKETSDVADAIDWVAEMLPPKLTNEARNQ